jgi:hypothetical protein
MSEAGKVVVMQKIDDIINFAGSMFECLPQQSYAMAVFVLWCGFGLVGVLVFRAARRQKQLDQLRRDVHLEMEECRRIILELFNSSSS